MEQAVGGTGTLPRKPFNDASKSHADLKDNFYRYFQQEVTGILYCPQPGDLLYTDTIHRSPRPDR